MLLLKIKAKAGKLISFPGLNVESVRSVMINNKQTSLYQSISKFLFPLNTTHWFQWIFWTDLQICLHFLWHRLQGTEFKKSLHSKVVPNAVELYETLHFW